MKTSILFFVLGSAILSITGCEKDEIPIVTRASNSIPNPIPNDSIPLSNDSTPPKAFAGSDVLVFLPADSCKLYGNSLYHMNGIKSYKWRKISGPSAFKFSSPDSFRTSVNDLIQGIYEFELMVVDIIGMTATDTATVTVEEMPIQQISFKNISWYSDGLMWGYGLTVKDIYSYIPMGSVFKVFIRNRLGGWVQALVSGSSGSEDTQYIFSIYNSNLSIWSGYDEEGSVDIMLVY